jgi:hypothetical protein
MKWDLSLNTFQSNAELARRNSRGSMTLQSRSAGKLSYFEGEEVMATRNSKGTKMAANQRLIGGVVKHLGKTTAVLAGASYTTKEIVQEVQAGIDAAQAVETAKAAYAGAVKAERDQNESSQELVSSLVSFIYAMYGTSPQTLADFGLAPRKRANLSPDALVERAAKARATRAARHTVGAKKRLLIKGVVDVTQPAMPAAAPSAPAARPVSTLNGAAPASMLNGTPQAPT